MVSRIRDAVGVDLKEKLEDGGAEAEVEYCKQLLSKYGQSANSLSLFSVWVLHSLHDLHGRHPL